MPQDEWTEIYKTAAADILEQTGVTRGFCLVVGSEDGRLAYELAQTKRSEDLWHRERSRRKSTRRAEPFPEAGLYGHRVTIHHADDASIPYSNYFANLIVSDRLLLTGELPNDARWSRVI